MTGPDSFDDNLEHVKAEWLKRLQARKVTREEACAILVGMKARLEFLSNLHSRIADHIQFAEKAKGVKQEIEEQSKEIEMVQRFIDSEP